MYKSSPMREQLKGSRKPSTHTVRWERTLVAGLALRLALALHHGHLKKNPLWSSGQAAVLEEQQLRLWAPAQLLLECRRFLHSFAGSAGSEAAVFPLAWAHRGFCPSVCCRNT